MFELRRNFCLLFLPSACFDCISYYLYPNLSEDADGFGGQMRGYPFSGVTSSGRVWRKAPESEVWSVLSVMFSRDQRQPQYSPGHHGLTWPFIYISTLTHLISLCFANFNADLLEKIAALKSHQRSRSVKIPRPSEWRRSQR